MLTKLIFLMILSFYSVNNIEPINVEDIRRNQIDLLSIKNTGEMYIIFYNQYCCKDCHVQLYNNIIEKNKNSHVVILLRCDNSSIYDKKTSISMAKNIFGEKVEYYFDIHTSKDGWPPLNPEGGLFGNYHVSKTPSLLYVDKNNITSFYSLLDLSSNNYLDKGCNIKTGCKEKK